MGECSFWYRPTRVVPDQRPLNGRCCCCCCRFTRYEAMNGGAKCRKWGGLGQLGGTQCHGQRHHSIEHIQLPIRLNRNHAYILYHFRDIASYLSKVADFDPPHLHLASLTLTTPLSGKIYHWHAGTCND